MLVDLLKGSKQPVSKQVEPGPVADEAIKWSEPCPGRGGATGLQWRDQLLERRNASLLGVSVCLAQCGATLSLDGQVLQVELLDFMFTLDVVLSLDAFRPSFQIAR